MAHSQNPFPCSGAWVRKRGIDDPHVEVLVEVYGAWRLIYQERLSHFTDGEVSHIIEPPGVRQAPKDENCQ